MNAHIRKSLVCFFVAMSILVPIVYLVVNCSPSSQPTEFYIHKWLMKFPIAKMESSRTPHIDISESTWLSEGTDFSIELVASYCKHAIQVAPIELGPQSIRALTALAPPEIAREQALLGINSSAVILRNECLIALQQVGTVSDIPALLEIATCDESANARANAYLASFSIFQRASSNLDNITKNEIQIEIESSILWSKKFDLNQTMQFVFKHLIPPEFNNSD